MRGKLLNAMLGGPPFLFQRSLADGKRLGERMAIGVRSSIGRSPVAVVRKFGKATAGEFQPLNFLPLRSL